MTELLNNIKSNYLKSWNFSYLIDNINHLHMNWRLRQNDDSLVASFLLPYLKRAFEDKDHKQEINQINLAHFLCNFISAEEADDPFNILSNPLILYENPYNEILNKLELLEITIPKLIDNKLFSTIQANKIVNYLSEDKFNDVRHKLINFGEKIKIIQHYCYHSKIFGLSKIMGKLLTRIWWIYHSSSPIMKSLYDFDNE
jgi:hypothetical protein